MSLLKTMMFFLPGARRVFSLSAFLRGPCNDLMSHGWCRRPGARRSSPCRFSMTIGHGHAVVCLLELGNGY